MDYTNQTEKIFNYLKFNCDIDEIAQLINFKKDFNNDLNLIGCFIKDYLILFSLNKNFSDENLYSEFVLYFEKNIQNKDEVLNNLLKFSKYYLMLVFEEIDDVQILSIVSTINLCYCLDCYPLVMQILNDYFEDKINNLTVVKMLQSVSSAVLNRFENPDDYDIDFYNVTIDEDGNIYTKNNILERKAV